MRALLFVLVGVETILLILVSVVFIRMVANETYERNRVQLSALSSNIKTEFSAVDDLVAKFHQDTALQKQLATVENPYTDSLDREANMIELTSSLGWLASDSKITSWIIYNNNGKRLLGNANDLNTYITGYKTRDYLKTVADGSMQAKWIFDAHSNRAVYIHNLFETRDLMMRPLGTIAFTIDLSFIRDFMEDSGIFSSSDFMVINRGKQYYATTPDKLAPVKRYLHSLGSLTGRFFQLDDLNYYVTADTITLNNMPFKVYYFLVNRQIIAKIVAVSLILFMIIMIVLFISIRGANYLLRRLIAPINLLAGNMQEFKDAEDLDRLREQASRLAPVHQQDEIGTLYSSFQRLMAEIDRLVVKDYQSQLLTQEMENKYLMAQIDPHFLYNTLNSINWIALAHDDTEAASVVTSLALLLREKADSKKQFNTLEEEMDIVSAYIKIQTVRFGERLRFSSTIPPDLDLQLVQVPKLIIQPIVENAVKYGVEKTDRPVIIEVAIHLTKERLLVTVFNDGDGFNAEAPHIESTGVGLYNIASRLHLLYGTQAGLEVKSKVGDVTTVTVWITRQAERNYQDGSSKFDHRG